MTLTTKEVLIAQFSASIDQPNWFVPLKNVLAEVTRSQAMKKVGAENSIWEIVAHLTFWNDRYLQRFKGNQLEESMISSNDDTFTFLEEGEDSWRRAVEKLLFVMEDWRNTLKNADDEKLESRVRPDLEGDWNTTIANINIHNSYHIGQILHNLKQQGVWNPKNGVH
ncbi:DinB family protein [Fredinandcohnia sp. 179-A 10B2 NHS]|uniref:DinB family protein n=1 Tax=Fredinandcohnia sp. 179-A 10B2 NHS TaxID=3235176 RepID=UPI00399FAAB7